MNVARSMLVRCLVKPFYRQHAGLFIFIFMITYGVVGMVDGAGIVEYHFSLILGILTNIYILLPVLLVWLLFAKKTDQFIVNRLRSPENAFLSVLCTLPSEKLYWWFAWVQFLIFIPVTVYALLVIGTGFYLHRYGSAVIVLAFNTLVTLMLAARYRKLLLNTALPQKKITSLPAITSSYASFYLKYILHFKKLLFAGIKLFSCGLLYLMVIHQVPKAYDMKMIYLFFSLSIFGHGLLIHQLRSQEDRYFGFYRNLPVSLSVRYMQYAFLYFLLLVPEFMTIGLLSSHYLRPVDGATIALVSWTLLVFLNSMLFVKALGRKDYLMLVLSVFFLFYFSVLSSTVPLLCMILLCTSVIIFMKAYYRYEHSIDS